MYIHHRDTEDTEMLHGIDMTGQVFAAALEDYRHPGFRPVL